MDAKPQRPLRITRQHDENAMPLALTTGKPAHQRHKSTPVLSGLLQNGAVKVGQQKRAAFADVSNHRGGQPPKDDSLLAAKEDTSKVRSNTIHLADPVSKDNALARKPLRSTVVKSNVTLPTQVVHLIESINNTSVNTILHSQDTKLPTTVQPARSNISTKRSTIVLKENIEPVQQREQETVQEVHTERNPSHNQNKQPAASSLHLEPNHVLSHPPLDQESATNLYSHVTASNASQALSTARVEAHNIGHPALESSFSVQNLSLVPDSQVNARAPLPLQADANANAVSTKSIPLRSQGYYEQTYDAASFDAEYTTRKSLQTVNDTTGCASILLALQPTNNSRLEIAAAKLQVESLRTPEEIEDDQWDTSMVAEYGEEIFDYMRELEERMRPNPHYMDHQSECQWSMRAVLLDWLVQVHARFTLLPETLFLSINYIDRFLSCKIVSLAKLQLVGATALFLAAKYEEVNCPSISEIVYMVDNGYTTEEILKAERFMLSMLAFELGWPGPMSFLRRISKADDYDLETRTLAKYFLEVTVMDERFVGCPPSSTAAASHCLARQMLRKGEWTPAHVHYSNYTYAQLLPLITVILECCEAPDKHHAAVYGKYQDKRYKKASFYVQTEIQNGFQPQPLSKRSPSFGALDLSLGVGTVANGWRGIN